MPHSLPLPRWRSSVPVSGWRCAIVTRRPRWYAKRKELARKLFPKQTRKSRCGSLLEGTCREILSGASIVPGEKQEAHGFEENSEKGAAIMSAEAAHQSYRRDLGDGLLLRWSTSDDTENIAQLVGTVFRDRDDEPLNEPLGHLMRELMSGTHPVMGPGDFALVEDTRKQGNPLVACTCLWRHTWEYEGIPFTIGRPDSRAQRGRGPSCAGHHRYSLLLSPLWV